MAVSIIDPDMGSGYDYDSLFDWEAGEQADLTSLTEIAEAKCRCTGGTADSTLVTVDGWTTSATYYIKIWTDPAESYRHAGAWPTGNVYRLEGSAIYKAMLTLKESYVSVEGLAVYNNDTDGHYALSVDPAVSSGASDLRVASCLLRGGLRTTSASAAHQRDGTLIMSNCVIYGSTSGGGFANWYGPNGPPVSVLYNCTVVANGGIGIFADWNGNVKNCYAGGNGGNDFGTITSKTTCASEDATGSSGLTGIAYSTSAGAYFTNITSGSEDLHIGASSALIDAATNLYADATYPFQDDIDGDDRGGSGASWDIGADEYVSAAPELAIPVASYHYHHH